MIRIQKHDSSASFRIKLHPAGKKNMAAHKTTPLRTAEGIRNLLKRSGSCEHAAGAQRFFKEQIKSHGWATADLRRSATALRRTIRKEFGLEFLVQVADRLFTGRVLDEKIYAVFLLEKITHELSDDEFELFESWLSRISNWADHDGLVHYLIGPMIVAKPVRIQRAFLWASSVDRWRRRAACVALIHATRQKMVFAQVVRLSNLLLKDEDDMVQKGLGWLLRETAKADAKRAVPYLMNIRKGAPRLVLRTACETLPPSVRKRILAKTP
jgi:3-methyladenine DNA glycosylase AlkD